MTSSFDFVGVIEGKQMRLKRRSDDDVFCPFEYGKDIYCGSHCAHFVVDNFDTMPTGVRKCQILLTCGKHASRYVEII